MRLILLALLVLLASPARAGVAVSILPLQAWAEELLAEDVEVLVGPGQSPALFEPTARQLAALSDSELFFAIGVPFEAALLPRLGRMFPEVEIVRLGAGIERLPWPEEELHGDHPETDPHIWLDPVLAASIIDEMAAALARVYPDRAPGIQERSKALRQRFVDLDARLRELLAPLRGQTILAYHPALGYFARTYGLHQAAVESGGSEPGARHLASLATRMEGQVLQVLVVEPQFAPNRARSVAGSLGLGVLVFDPLSTDLVAELESFTRALVAEAGKQP